jgi:hypothetical protein
MSKEIAVPDYLKRMMAGGEVQDTTSQMLSDAGGVPRLTTKGKTFRFKEGEEEVKAGDSVNVVIIGINPQVGLAHTFYKDAYNPNSNEPPDCSSQNGATPDPWISNPQNDKCATCPNQVWGSAKSMSGGKAKACRDSRQLLVARAQDFGEDPNKATLYLMQVTVNSLRNFSNYGKELAAAGFPGPQFVVTKLLMDEESSVPMVHFEIVGPLNEELGKASWKRSEAREWDIRPALPPGGNDKRALPTPEPVDDDGDIPSDNDVVATQEKANLDKADVNELIDNW